MGDNTPSVNETTRSTLEALARNAPDAIRAITGTAPGVASTQAGIDVAMAPIYNQLYKEGQLSSAGTEADVAEGPGKRLVASADASQRALDPEYYSSRGLIGDALKKYLGGYDPNELSPTELAGISRGINATSGPATPSNLSTIKNAQTFGAAGTQRWQNFGDAITKASAAIPALKSGINGFAVSTSRGANPLPNNSQFALANNFGFANNALGNISATQRDLLAQQEANSPMNLALKSSQVLSNVGNAVGSAAGGF